MENTNKSLETSEAAEYFYKYGMAIASAIFVWFISIYLCVELINFKSAAVFCFLVFFVLVLANTFESIKSLKKSTDSKKLALKLKKQAEMLTLLALFGFLISFLKVGHDLDTYDVSPKLKEISRIKINVSSIINKKFCLVDENKHTCIHINELLDHLATEKYITSSEKENSDILKDLIFTLKKQVQIFYWKIS